MNAYQAAFLVLCVSIALLIHAAVTQERDESFAEAFKVTLAIALVCSTIGAMCIGAVAVFLWLGEVTP